MQSLPGLECLYAKLSLILVINCGLLTLYCLLFFGLGNSQQSISLSHPNGLYETYRILQIVVEIKCKLARGVEHTNNLVHLSNTELLSNFEIQQKFFFPTQYIQLLDKMKRRFPSLDVLIHLKSRIKLMKLQY